MKLLRYLVLWCALVSPVFAQSGFHNCSNTDLDSVFAPWHAGWPQAAATGYNTAGSVDLNSRYAPLSTGTPASATCSHIAGGADLNTVFAGIGTTGVTITTGPSVVSGTAAAGNPSGTVTSNTTSCAASHGNSGAYSYSWHIATGSASPTAPSSATSAVTGTVNAGTTSGGTWYCSISDGITSANSSAVAWSLTNSTPATWSYSGTLTAAAPGGSLFGFVGGTFGSISPTTINGNLITDLVTSTGTAETTFSVDVSYDPGQFIFSTLLSTQTSPPFSLTLHTSAATYSYSGGVASWTWAEDVYVAAGSFSITIN